MKNRRRLPGGSSSLIRREEQQQQRLLKSRGASHPLCSHPGGVRETRWWARRRCSPETGFRAPGRTSKLQLPTTTLVVKTALGTPHCPEKPQGQHSQAVPNLDKIMPETGAGRAAFALRRAIQSEHGQERNPSGNAGTRKGKRHSLPLRPAHSPPVAMPASVLEVWVGFGPQTIALQHLKDQQVCGNGTFPARESVLPDSCRVICGWQTHVCTQAPRKPITNSGAKRSPQARDLACDISRHSSNVCKIRTRTANNSRNGR